MKYALIIPDGAADLPVDYLDGKTPLEAAVKPNMDWVSSNGKCGSVRNIPNGLPCGSDVAILSVFGYDPREGYTGRAPLEAAAQEIRIADDELVFRCNLVTIAEGMMQDNTAGHITTEEGREIIKELNRIIAGQSVTFHPGVGYRHLMTCAGEIDVETTPPHDILGKVAEDYLPTGKGADRLRTLIRRSEEILTDCQINVVRRDLGENPATSIWLWGQGKMPRLQAFTEKFGLSGAAITAVDLVRGLAKLIGWDVIEVEGATGYLDTNYAGKGAAAVKALDDHDIVCVHVEATDEAGHSADAQAKVNALQQIDKHIVGPVLERLKAEQGEWRILIMPDHPTPCSIRTHTADAVPFAIAGKRIESILSVPFSEANATESDLHIRRGHEVMEYFLTVR